MKPPAVRRVAEFDPRWLGTRLQELLPPEAARPPRYVVAWSGGADSTALLFALAELRKQAGTRAFSLRAIHVDHGLQPASSGWAKRCRADARRWRVPLTVKSVAVVAESGESPEQAARDARYRAFTEDLRPGECLLLAQHARDQLETLLLRLLRGGGPRGLAAIPERRPLGAGWLLRPLLDRHPQALRDHLQANGVDWIEDPSNDDARYDRNYLRAEVLPRLEARWPGALRTTARSTRLLRESERTIDASARRDLNAVRDGDGIAIPPMRRLSMARRAGTLRAWFDDARIRQPDEARLAQILSALSLREDARVEVRWADNVLRRHDDRLVLTHASEPAAVLQDLDWRWAEGMLTLPHGRLVVAADAQGDLDLDRLPPVLRIRARPRGRARDLDGRSVDVKSLLQESGVPSWRRASLPFLHDAREERTDGGLVAIADLWFAASLRVSARTRHRGRIVWQAS
ncbi:MAG: tRNA lysidine(34) synthetase TilS [Steroidobacteraceae bacterium]